MDLIGIRAGETDEPWHCLIPNIDAGKLWSGSQGGVCPREEGRRQDLPDDDRTAASIFARGKDFTRWTLCYTAESCGNLIDTRVSVTGRQGGTMVELIGSPEGPHPQSPNQRPQAWRTLRLV